MKSILMLLALSTNPVALSPEPTPGTKTCPGVCYQAAAAGADVSHTKSCKKCSPMPQPPPRTVPK